jgi:hypothetical protein
MAGVPGRAILWSARTSSDARRRQKQEHTAAIINHLAVKSAFLIMSSPSSRMDMPSAPVTVLLPRLQELLAQGRLGKKQRHRLPQRGLALLDHPEVVSARSTTYRLNSLWAYKASPVTTFPASSSWDSKAGATVCSLSFFRLLTPLLTQHQPGVLGLAGNQTHSWHLFPVNPAQGLPRT